MTTALIVCGALARPVLALCQRPAWDAQVLGVPSLLHNDPARIPAAVLKRLRQARATFADVIVVYGDCGTAGRLDQLLAAEGVGRVAGPHCFEMLAGPEFEPLIAAEPGTYFLTDYLVQSFDHLVLAGRGWAWTAIPTCATLTSATTRARCTCPSATIRPWRRGRSGRPIACGCRWRAARPATGPWRRAYWR